MSPIEQWIGIGVAALYPSLPFLRGVHACNYSDLPLWDFVFGTFRNPKTWHGETGFDAPADRRYAAMLAFVDVNAPLIGEGSFGQKSEADATSNS